MAERALNGSANSPQGEAEQVKMERLDKLTAERDEYLNGWKRAKADLINYQKDDQKRLEEVIKLANAGLIMDLLAVLDSFTLAEQHKESGGSLIKGQLWSILKRHGLEEIAAAVGQKFDPLFHESVGEAESKEYPSGSVAEVVSGGYILNSKVIRPAKVKLAK